MEDGRSWLVAACCCFSNLTFYGLSRLSGIVLVAATSTFQVPRAAAAMPFSISTAIRNLTGVFAGQLGHRFGVGPIVTVGCLIASLGSGLCFFANDVSWISVCWGGFFGLGFGLVTCLLPLAINQHFTWHNGAASGISYSGSYIGSFVFPPVVVRLLDSYGLQGTFLVLSGLILHVLLVGMVLGTDKKKGSASGRERNGAKVKNELVCVSSCQDDKHAYTLGENDLKMFERKQVDFMRGEHSYGSSILASCRSSVPGACPPKECNEEGRVHSLLYVPEYIIQPHSRDNGIEGSFFINGGNNAALSLKSSHLPELKIGFNVDERKRMSSVLPDYSDINCLQGLRDKRCEFPNTRISLDKMSISKRKQLKVRYKIKLKKLKTALETTFINMTSTKPESVHLNSTGVKLLSYQRYHSFRAGSKTVGNSFSQNSDSGLPSTNRDAFFPYDSGGAKDVETRAAPTTMESTRDAQPQNTDGDSSGGQPAVIAHSMPESLSPKAFRSSRAKEQCSHPHQGNGLVKSNATEINIGPGNQSTNDLTTCDKNCSSLTAKSQSTKACPTEKTPRQATSNTDAQNKKRLPDWVHLLKEPMFLAIGVTMSVHTLAVVGVLTTIEDYARDIGIDPSETYYSLMAMSSANLVGTLTLGNITDRKLLSRPRFLSLCFFGMAASLVAFTLVVHSLASLVAMLAVYCLMESGVLITFPVLTKEFAGGEKRQAVAIASSNVLSAPTVMLVPFMIGHYRDKIGCYSGLYHLLGAMALACSIVWLVAPSLCDRKNFKEKLQPLMMVVDSKKWHRRQE